MTSQGHASVIYERALMTRDLPAAIAAAHNLPKLAPSASLPLVLLYLEHDRARYPRVAVRWLISLASCEPLEVSAVAELATALELLSVDSRQGRERLGEVAARLGLANVARAAAGRDRRG